MVQNALICINYARFRVPVPGSGSCIAVSLFSSSQKVEPDSCNAYCNKNVVRLDDCDSDLRDTSHAFCLSPHAPQFGFLLSDVLMAYMELILQN